MSIKGASRELTGKKDPGTALATTNKDEAMPIPMETIRPLTAQDVIQQVELIKEIQQKVMQKDVHYGVIPGCGKKPTLLKAGAEKLCLTFRLATNVAEKDDLSTPDMIRYRIKVNLLRISDGQFVGSGVGECSSAEEKYNWKKVYKEEYDTTPADRRKSKADKWGTKLMVRTNPFDLANTILKMAKKRALVDAVLTSTGASDLFTQDIEEMDMGSHDEPPVTGKDIANGLNNVTSGKISKQQIEVLKVLYAQANIAPDKGAPMLGGLFFKEKTGDLTSAEATKLTGWLKDGMAGKCNVKKDDNGVILRFEYPPESENK